MQNICLVCENPHVVPFTTINHGGSTQQDYTAMVAVTGLQGGTYNVKVQLASGAFSSGQFTTAPSNMSLDTFTFVVLTDFVLGITPKADLPGPRDCGAGGSTLFQDCPEITGATFGSADLVAAAFVLIGGDFDHRNPSLKNDKGNPPHCPSSDSPNGITLCNYRRMFQGLYDPASDGMGPFVNLILRKRWIAHVWDDHDYATNNSNGQYTRKALARQAFAEYVPTFPLCPGAIGAVGCVWQEFRYGQLAEFFLIDSRSQRDPRSCLTDQTCTLETISMLDGVTITGHPTGQYTWLTNGICAAQASGVRWKIVFTPVVWNTTMNKTDSWFGFQHEHDAIISAIQACGAQGVVFISGDLHAGGLDNGTNAVRPEMLVPASNFTPQSPVNCQSNPTIGSWSNGVYTNGPTSSPCNGYGVVTVSFDTISFTVKNSAGAIPPGMMAPMIITFPGPQP